MGEYLIDPDYVAHHGVKGQKWGLRRYQNSDGSLTAAGRQRYGVGEAIGRFGKSASGALRTAGTRIGGAMTRANSGIRKSVNSLKGSSAKSNSKSGKQRKHLTKGQKIAIGLGVAATATAVGAAVVHHINKKNMNLRIDEAMNSLEKTKYYNDVVSKTGGLLRKRGKWAQSDVDALNSNINKLADYTRRARTTGVARAKGDSFVQKVKNVRRGHLDDFVDTNPYSATYSGNVAKSLGTRISEGASRYGRNAVEAGRNGLNRASNGIRNGANAARSSAKTFAGKASYGAKAAGYGIKTAAGRAANNAYKGAMRAGEAIGTNAAKATSTARRAGNAIRSNTTYQAISAAGKAGVNSARNAGRQAFNSAKNYGNRAAAAARNYGSRALSEARSTGQTFNAVGRAAGRNAVDTARRYGNRALGEARSTAQILNTVGRVGVANAVNGARNIGQNAANTVGNARRSIDEMRRRRWLY